MRRAQLLVICVVPLAGSCLDDHMAEECWNTYTCPPPPTTSPPQHEGPSCPGQCLPLGYENWSSPFLAWMGSAAEVPAKCPDQMQTSYSGVAAPANVACGACSCQPSTGSCALPQAASANTGHCQNIGSTSTTLDAPAAWDGSCTATAAISGGVQSVVVAPLAMSESCAPVAAAAPAPGPSQLVAMGCASAGIGTCASSGDVCLPVASGWTYCISHDGAGDEYTSACPKDSPYKELHVFADAYTAPACSPCTCGEPEGSSCESLVSFYADASCSDDILSVVALSSASVCGPAPGSSLASMSASPPTYTPGTCKASGGVLMSPPVPIAPKTLCCLPLPKFP